VGKSFGLLLLDAQYQVVFANDEALSALQSHHEHEGSACTNALVMQNLQSLITMFANDGGLPARFNHAGHAWHSSRFTLPNGPKPEMMSALVTGPGKASQSPAASFAQIFHLTSRETEALELFMKGFSVKETAAQMKISSSTAKVFLRLITIKMGVSGRAEMMSKVLSYMCAGSLTCPFRTNLPIRQQTSPNAVIAACHSGPVH